MIIIKMIKKTIGILGGSFDPPHIAHVRLAQIAQKYCDEIWIVPCGYRDDKPWMSSYEIRYEMCKLAFRDMKICDFERGLPIVSTYILMRDINEQYPEENFYFIIGTDLLISLDTWTYYEELVSCTNFLVFHREGVAMNEKCSEYLVRENFRDTGENVQIELSSTFVRESIKESRRKSLPDERLKDLIKEIIGIDQVAEVVYRHNLYLC